MKVDFETGRAVVTAAEGTGLDPMGIPKAVRDAGFAAAEIHVTATGVLAKDGDLLNLDMSGPINKMVLAGGSKVKELAATTEVFGRSIRVTGELHPSHADKPPGMTVEVWSSLELTKE